MYVSAMRLQVTWMRTYIIIRWLLGVLYQRWGTAQPWITSQATDNDGDCDVEDNGDDYDDDGMMIWWWWWWWWWWWLMMMKAGGGHRHTQTYTHTHTHTHTHKITISCMKFAINKIKSKIETDALALSRTLCINSIILYSSPRSCILEAITCKTAW